MKENPFAPIPPVVWMNSRSVWIMPLKYTPLRHAWSSATSPLFVSRSPSVSRNADNSPPRGKVKGEENIRFMHAVRDALKKPALWESRPRDVSYVLDALHLLENRVPGLVGKIDADRIGVGGHSMGSYTTEAIAGALVDLPGHSGTNFADPRVKAVLCLSPQGPGQFGLNDHSFDRISLPYMGMTGSLDSLGPVASPAWHKTPFDRSQPGDKYHLFIEDAYLKGNARAKQYLQSDALEKSSHGAVRLSRR